MDEPRHDASDPAEFRAVSTAFRRDLGADLAHLDRLIATEIDDGDRGAALLDRALLRQGSDDPSLPADDAREALRLLRSQGRRSEAALAAAAAAGMVFRTDDIEAAVDLAVEAMIMIDGQERSTRAARALNSVALLFMQISAFEYARDFSLRALAALDDDSDPIADIVRYTHCVLLIEGWHAGVGLPLDTGHSAATALRESVHDVPRRLLGAGCHAELTMIDRPDEIATLRLDESVLDIGAPRLSSWFRLVLAQIDHARGDDERAAALLDEAVPHLSSVRDDHRLVRGLELRSRVRAALGDHRGALADATARGDVIRSWHTEQVGRLAVQISQRAQLERRAIELAEEIDVDALTGVGSRRLLEMTLDELAVDQPGDVAVVVIDLDHFKTVNDTLGHSTGDAVLRRVGEVLRHSARTNDLVARLGGEEFVAVFPGAGVERALEYADDVRARLVRTDWNDIAPGSQVRASAGVAVGQLADVRRVLDRADEALYEAKRQGRDRSVVA